MNEREIEKRIVDMMREDGCEKYPRIGEPVVIAFEKVINYIESLRDKIKELEEKKPDRV